MNNASLQMEDSKNLEPANEPLKKPRLSRKGYRVRITGTGTDTPEGHMALVEWLRSLT